MLWPIAPIKSFRSRPPPTYSVHSRNSHSCVAVADFFVFFSATACPQHDEVVLLTPQQYRPATPRAAARLMVSCGRPDVVGGCSTLRNDCSSGRHQTAWQRACSRWPGRIKVAHGAHWTSGCVHCRSQNSRWSTGREPQLTEA